MAKLKSIGYEILSKNLDKSKSIFCINISFFRQLGMPFVRLDLASLLLASLLERKMDPRGLSALLLQLSLSF